MKTGEKKTETIYILLSASVCVAMISGLIA